MRTSTVRLLALALFACAPEKRAPQPFAPDRGAEAELLVADRSFARDTAERGLDGWVSGFADDGAQVAAGRPLVEGRAEIRATMTPVFADQSTRVRWDPERAQVAAAGDLGYTYGHATVEKRGDDGSTAVLAKMQYLMVWKRQSSGAWKVAMDVAEPEP